MRYFPVLLSLFFFSCGSLELSYRFADWKIESAVEDLIELNDAQQDFVQVEADAFLDVNRRRILPALADFLEDGALVFEAPDSTGLVKLVVRAEELLARASLPALHPAAVLLSDLDSSQVEGLAIGLEEWNRDWSELHALDTFSLHQRVRVWQTVQEIEEWTGPLNGRQKKAVRDGLLLTPPVEIFRTFRRIRLQGEVLDLLRQKAASSEIKDFLLRWHFRPDSTRSWQEKAAQKDWQVGFAQMLLSVWRSLDSNQRQNARERMRKMATRIREL